jgi:phosphatidate cytidylyltransferase
MRAIIPGRGTATADALLARTLSGLVGVPAILGIAWLGGVAFALGTGAVLVTGAAELLAAAMPPARRGELLPWRQRPLAYLGLALVALMVAAAYHGGEWWTGAAALAVALLLLASILRPRPSQVLGEWGLTTAAVLYVGLLGSHLVGLRQGAQGLDWTILAIFGAFTTDTSAYLVGRAVGRRRMAPHLSPGKTWEGTLGGLLLGAGGVVLINWATGLRLRPWELAPLAALLPVAAVLGDLGESFIKRGTGTKDASALIPGHGGFLDRLDSVLLTAPLVYYWRLWVVG